MSNEKQGMVGTQAKIPPGMGALVGPKGQIGKIGESEIVGQGGKRERAARAIMGGILREQ